MAQAQPQRHALTVGTEGGKQADAPVVHQDLIDLLRSWREDGDAHEQRETWAYLKRVLDEDRLSERKLFP